MIMVTPSTRTVYSVLGGDGTGYEMDEAGTPIRSLSFTPATPGTCPRSLASPSSLRQRIERLRQDIARTATATAAIRAENVQLRAKIAATAGRVAAVEKRAAGTRREDLVEPPRYVVKNGQIYLDPDAMPPTRKAGEVLAMPPRRIVTRNGMTYEEP